jgi:hypothetical protein
MKMEQTLEHPLTKMDANQAKTDAILRQLKAGLQHLKEQMRVGKELLKEEMLTK